MVNRMVTSAPGLSGIHSGGILDESEQELRENGWMKDLVKCASILPLTPWGQEVNRMHQDAIESEEEKTVYPCFHLEMISSLNEAAASMKNSKKNDLLRTGRNSRRMGPNMPFSGAFLSTQIPMSGEIGDAMSTSRQCCSELQEERGELPLYSGPMALDPCDISGLDSISCILLRRSESDLIESASVSKSTIPRDDGRDLLVKNEIQLESMEDERRGEHDRFGSFKEEETMNRVVISSPSWSTSSRFQAFLVYVPGLAAVLAPIAILCLLVAALCARDLQVVPPRRGSTLMPPLPSTTGNQKKNFGNGEEKDNNLTAGQNNYHPVFNRWGGVSKDECEKSSPAQQQAAAGHHLVMETEKQKSPLASTLETNEMVIPTLLEWRDAVLQSFNGTSPNQLAVTEGAAILERLLEMEKELFKPDKRSLWWCHMEMPYPGVPKSVARQSRKSNSCAAHTPQDGNVNQQQYRHHIREGHLSSLEASLVAMAKKMAWYRSRSTFAEYEMLDFLNACGAAAGLTTQGEVAEYNRRHYWCRRSNHSDGGVRRT